MKEYKNYTIPELKYEEVIKDVFNMYNDLLCIYIDQMNKYKELNIALDEADHSKDTDIDLYVHAINKINFLSVDTPEYPDKELEIFINNSELIPFLETYIKKQFDIKKSVNFNDFSFFDTYINKDYINIKDNYPVIRMIRAIKYYKEYINVYYKILTMRGILNDPDNIRHMISYDYSDIETLNTLAVIKELYDNENETDLYNKYKTIFIFTNPQIEFYFHNTDFNEEHPFIICDFNDKVLKQIKSQVIKTLITIQNNKLINTRDGSDIIKSKLTLKQSLDILFHYNKELSAYNNRFELLKNDYLDNVEEIGLLFSYLEQVYVSLDEKALEDLDHLFSLMCKNDYNTTYGSTKLCKKVVNHFFNKEKIFEEKGIQRTKKDE